MKKALYRFYEWYYKHLHSICLFFIIYSSASIALNLMIGKYWYCLFYLVIGIGHTYFCRREYKDKKNEIESYEERMNQLIKHMSDARMTIENQRETIKTQEQTIGTLKSLINKCEDK